MESNVVSTSCEATNSSQPHSPYKCSSSLTRLMISSVHRCLLNFTPHLLRKQCLRRSKARGIRNIDRHTTTGPETTTNFDTCQQYQEKMILRGRYQYDRKPAPPSAPAPPHSIPPFRNSFGARCLKSRPKVTRVFRISN